MAERYTVTVFTATGRLLHRDAVLLVSRAGTAWEGQFDPPLSLSNEQRVYLSFASGRTAEAIVGGGGAVVHGKGPPPI